MDSTRFPLLVGKGAWSGGGGWGEKKATERTLGFGLRSSVQPSAGPSGAGQPPGEGAAAVSCVDCGLAAAPGTGRVLLSPSSDLPPSVSPKDQGEPSAQWLLCEAQRGVQPSPLGLASLPVLTCPGKGLGREQGAGQFEVRGVQLPGDADQWEAVKAGFLSARGRPYSRTGLPWPRDTHRGPGVTGPFTLM